MAKRKPKEEPAYWTVVDRDNAENNWPFLPLFTSFSSAFNEAQRMNEKHAEATGRPKFMTSRYITSRLMFPQP